LAQAVRKVRAHARAFIYQRFIAAATANPTITFA